MEMAHPRVPVRSRRIRPGTEKVGESLRRELALGREQIRRPARWNASSSDLTPRRRTKPPRRRGRQLRERVCAHAGGSRLFLGRPRRRSRRTITRDAPLSPARSASLVPGVKRWRACGPGRGCSVPVISELGFAALDVLMERERGRARRRPLRRSHPLRRGNASRIGSSSSLRSRVPSPFASSSFTSSRVSSASASR